MDQYSAGSVSTSIRESAPLFTEMNFCSDVKIQIPKINFLNTTQMCVRTTN
jgi:hypothetical protein